MFCRAFAKPAFVLILFSVGFAYAAGPENRSPLPTGAPIIACRPHGAANFDGLRTFDGSAPVPLVSDCGNHGATADSCYTQYLSLSKPDEYQGDLVAPDATLGAWTCAAVGGRSGWVPSDRLAPVPSTPAVTTRQWLGTWINTHMGAGRDRLILTRSPAGRGVVHVEGKAYYTNAAHSVNFGGMGGDALAMGPFLHTVDQTVQPGCILDLTYNTANETFRAIDNQQCGGFNVSFNGVWRRLAADK
jgi:hypothetical protein